MDDREGEERELQMLQRSQGATYTIDLNTLFTKDVTSSGSFNLRGAETTSLGRLLQALPIPALLVDRNGTIVFTNEPTSTKSPDYRESQGKQFRTLFPRPKMAATAEATVKRVFTKRKPEVLEIGMQVGETRIWGRIHLRALRLGSDRFILVLVEDLTLERKQIVLNRLHEDELRRAHDDLEIRVRERTAELVKTNEQMRQEISERTKAESRLKLAGQIIESSNEGIIITDLRGNIENVNQAFCKTTGFSRNEVVGKNLALIQTPHHDSEFYQKVWQTLLKTGEWKGEVWDRRKNGEVYPKLLSASAVRNDKGEVTHYVAIFSDITKIKQTEKRLERLAHYDPLTGLPNRILFHDRLQQALVQAQRRNTMVAIMILDLDRFKNINDTMGHHFGDELLVAVAQRFSECLRESDTACRLGGDEFAVVLQGMKDARSAAQVAAKIDEVLSKPYDLNGREVFITASMGITLYPDDGLQVGQLLQNADTALYHAKDQGKNNFQFFSREMNLSVQKRLRLEHLLREALLRDRFRLHYQPMVELSTGRIIGMEALLRLAHPQRGVLSAARLIPVAEETGLIVPIGDWVLKTACEQNKAWQDMGLDGLRVAVNISGRQLKQRDMAQNILRTVEQSKLEPRFLEIELTESVMMDDAEATMRTFELLRSNGIKISLDDFGTGYSSLSYLREIPIDRLKIDRSFLTNVDTNSYEQAIVQAIMTVAHGRDIKVIAEGVETQEQLQFLKAQDCDEVQGFLLGPPAPVKKFTKILQSNGREIADTTLRLK